jgi:hypothetical protein
MIDCHADYAQAIRLAKENVKRYSESQWAGEHHAKWWREVMRELIKLRRNHNLTDHEYYMEITGELDEAS